MMQSVQTDDNDVAWLTISCFNDGVTLARGHNYGAAERLLECALQLQKYCAADFKTRHADDISEVSPQPPSFCVV